MASSRRGSGGRSVKAPRRRRLRWRFFIQSAHPLRPARHDRPVRGSCPPIEHRIPANRPPSKAGRPLQGVWFRSAADRQTALPRASEFRHRSRGCSHQKQLRPRVGVLRVSSERPQRRKLVLAASRRARYSRRRSPSGRSSGISDLPANRARQVPLRLKLTSLCAFTKRLMEGCVISLLRGSADPLVEKFGSLADEDAPSLRLHTINDDSCCLGRAYGCVIAVYKES